MKNMINITEEVLIDLGFIKNEVTAEESGGNAFYYFSYEKNNQCLLISCGNDETINNQYYTVELFEGSAFGYVVNETDLKTFICCLNRFVQKI